MKADGLLAELEALTPKVFLVDANGKKRAKCPNCGKMVDLVGHHQRKVGALCLECKASFVAETVKRWWESPDKRYIETQHPFNIRWMDDEWLKMLRAAIAEAKRQYSARRVIQMDKPA